MRGSSAQSSVVSFIDHLSEFILFLHSRFVSDSLGDSPANSSLSQRKIWCKLLQLHFWLAPLQSDKHGISECLAHFFLGNSEILNNSQPRYSVLLLQ